MARKDTLGRKIILQKRTRYHAEGALYSVDLWPANGWGNFWCRWTLGKATWRFLALGKLDDIGFRLEAQGIDWRLLQWEASPSNYYRKNPFDPDNKDNRRVVYFAQAESGGLIKIGCTHDPERRLKGIQMFSPLPLRIIATMPGGNYDEYTVHAQFAHLRKHGEWFEDAPELLEFIKTHTIDVLTR